MERALQSGMLKPLRIQIVQIRARLILGNEVRACEPVLSEWQAWLAVAIASAQVQLEPPSRKDHSDRPIGRLLACARASMRQDGHAKSQTAV